VMYEKTRHKILLSIHIPIQNFIEKKYI
jgi:hypothetical protein